MANFFNTAIDMLDENNIAFQGAFAFAEEARAFPPNPEVENLGIKIGVLGRLIEKTAPAKQQSSFLREELKDAILAYKKIFKKDHSRTSANLEDVFSKLELFKEKSDAADKTYDRLQYVINGLFNQLDKDLQGEFSVAAHHDLCQFVANTNDIEHTFISFNYDLWLEKALFKKELWHPIDGHGSYSFEYYSKPEDDIFPQSGRHVDHAKKFNGEHKKSKVKVLKPHGSLSWRFGKKHGNGLVILENGENSSITYNNTWDLPALHFTGGTELTLIPLVVPPVPNKIRSHPLFWETDKDVNKALIQADIVVIVGWSMPLTDRYLQNTILKSLNCREEQIKKLIVCDKQDSGGYLLSRFESIFRPRKIKTWLNGFSGEFVDFLEKELP